MLDSITWGTWDQLQWQGENDAAAWGQGSLTTSGSTTSSSASSKKMRSASQANGANASEWRKPRPRVSDVPLFVRLLNKLEREVPSSVPEYQLAPLQSAAPKLSPSFSSSLSSSSSTRSTSATQATMTTPARIEEAALDASLSAPGAFVVDWRQLSEAVAPSAGGLDDLRAERKEQQVSNLLSATCALVDHQLALRRRHRPQSAAFGAASDGSAWKPVKVVEFCGGAGYVALPLAALYPPEDVFVLLLDMKEQSLEIARRRVASAGLTNVKVRRARLEDFNASESFDIGVALHACGPATDLSLECCLQAGAAYVMSPCCVGKIRSSRRAGITRRAKGVDGVRLAQRDLSLVAAAARQAKEQRKAQQRQQRASEPSKRSQEGVVSSREVRSDEEEDEKDGEGGGDAGEDQVEQEKGGLARRAEEPTDAAQLVYPRSAALRSVLSTAEWATVARAADFGHRDLSEYDAEQRKRRVAKAFVEHDRQLRAQEAGYVTHTCVMAPRTATPKNDVITGWPRHWGLKAGNNDGSSNDGNSNSSSVDSNHSRSISDGQSPEGATQSPGSLKEEAPSAAGANSGHGAGRSGPPTLESLERFLFAPEVPQPEGKLTSPGCNW